MTQENENHKIAMYAACIQKLIQAIGTPVAICLAVIWHGWSMQEVLRKEIHTHDEFIRTTLTDLNKKSITAIEHQTAQSKLTTDVLKDARTRQDVLIGIMEQLKEIVESNNTEQEK
jgi:hypothetical protein